MPDVLLIGYSSIARRRVIPALETLDEVGRVHVASIRSTPSTGAFGKLGAVFDSYRAALDEAAAEVVYVTTVNADHLTWALAALESGRHVIVDKPACTSARDTETLVRTAEGCERAVAEATVYGTHPLLTIIRTQADLTECVRATAVFSIPPLPADDFRYRPELGGGALNDLGPYAISIGRLLFDSEPSSIDCVVLTRSSTGVETAFSVLADYGAGRSLVGHFGFDTHYVNRLEVLDRERLLEVDRVFTSPPDFPNELRVTSGQRRSTVPIPASDTFAAFFREFLSDIDAGSTTRYHHDMLADARALQRLRDTTTSPVRTETS